jgi:heterodisulfide reductase subunit A
MTAALTLANAGRQVTLVERGAALGGMLRDVHVLYPDRRNAAELVARKVQAVTQHPRIEVLLESPVTKISGTVGRYTVNIGGPNQSNGPAALDVGAIIVATGAHAWQPGGLFRYDGQRVVTQFEFESELRKSQGVSQSPDGPVSGDADFRAEVANVVMILCAGQRNDAIPYCSGVCCMGALMQAMEVRPVSAGRGRR